MALNIARQYFMDRPDRATDGCANVLRRCNAATGGLAIRRPGRCPRRAPQWRRQRLQL